MSFKNTYNEIATNYDDRFANNPLSTIGLFLADLVRTNNSKNILELGCGTGHWLKSINDVTNIFGADISREMLFTAKTKNPSAKLTCCDGNSLPFRPQSFNAVIVINAIHMFTNKAEIFQIIKSLLTRLGKLLVVTISPFEPSFEMYIHKYFDGTRNFDLRRFISVSEIESLLSKHG